jgi:NAD(P)-dependent dehydrogenase (short-subunit alcohol dehydrogenase family)
MVLAPHANKRFGKVEEAAALIAFLLEGESKYITGEAVRIDGGMCA